MRPLTAEDPRTLGGHRLLARIGTGGMGVVYLARAEDGALVALKVIRAEYAADPEFRARFRREAQAGARVDGRWTAPVTAADPEAAEPWIATVFVPGPSLAEVVAAQGPLPARTVRALGARLAGALTAVHEAGLVHRDIKPGNVLLALDGPRLIDFGIARASGATAATALTETDVVIGTPGYLSPEQARGRDEPVGPPSDVFSLGCLLAYATTGRSPFAGQVAAAAVFRAVHEEPDLSAIADEELRVLVARCLAKPPADRPTAPELRAALGASGASGAKGTPGTSGASGTAGASGTPDTAGASGTSGASEADAWLPPAVPALIAEASARVLDLPEPEPPRPSAPPQDRPPAPVAPTRRRFLQLGASAGVVAAGAATAALLTRGHHAPPATRPTRAVAVQVDLSGLGRVLGAAVRDGVALAVDDHNARADRAFDLTAKVYDDAGDSARSAAVARQIVADNRISAVIGLTSDITASAAKGVYDLALLAMVTAWAGSSDLYDTDPTNAPAVFQLRPSNLWLSAPLARYLRQDKAQSTLVVRDGAGDFAARVTTGLRVNSPTGDTVTPLVLDAGGVDPVANAATGRRAQSLVYAGEDAARAASLAVALRAKGFSGACLTGEVVLDPAFPAKAGAAAQGWVGVTTTADPTRLPSAASFVRSFGQRHGAVPHGAVEAYDALGFVAAGLGAAGAGSVGAVDRGTLVHRLRAQSYRGLVRTLPGAGTGAGDVGEGTFLWRVTTDGPTYVGRGLSV